MTNFSSGKRRMTIEISEELNSQLKDIEFATPSARKEWRSLFPDTDFAKLPLWSVNKQQLNSYGLVDLDDIVESLDECAAEQFENEGDLEVVVQDKNSSMEVRKYERADSTLLWVASPDDAETIVFELMDEFEKVCSRHSRRRAEVWFYATLAELFVTRLAGNFANFLTNGVVGIFVKLLGK